MHLVLHLKYLKDPGPEHNQGPLRREAGLLAPNWLENLSTAESNIQQIPLGSKKENMHQ